MVGVLWSPPPPARVSRPDEWDTSETRVGAATRANALASARCEYNKLQIVMFGGMRVRVRVFGLGLGLGLGAGKWLELRLGLLRAHQRVDSNHERVDEEDAARGRGLQRRRGGGVNSEVRSQCGVNSQ